MHALKPVEMKHEHQHPGCSTECHRWCPTVCCAGSRLFHPTVCCCLVTGAGGSVAEVLREGGGRGREEEGGERGREEEGGERGRRNPNMQAVN